MKTSQRQIGSNTVVTVLESRFGADKAAAFKEALAPPLENGSGLLILDLSRVEFIDSSGLGAILSLLKRADKRRELAICGLTDPVAGMFRLTRMDRVFTIHPTVEDALAAHSHS